MKFRNLRHPERNLKSISSVFPFFSLPWQLGTTNLLSASIQSLFWMLHITGFLPYMVVCDWLLSISINMGCSRIIHVEACISTSFLFTAEQHSTASTCPIFFNHSSINSHLGCFLFFFFLVIISNAAKSFYVQVFVQSALCTCGFGIWEFNQPRIENRIFSFLTGFPSIHRKSCFQSKVSWMGRGKGLAVES